MLEFRASGVGADKRPPKGDDVQLHPLARDVDAGRTYEECVSLTGARLAIIKHYIFTDNPGSTNLRAAPSGRLSPLLKEDLQTPNVRLTSDGHIFELADGMNRRSHLSALAPIS